LINSFKRILTIIVMSLVVCLPHLFGGPSVDDLAKYMMTSKRWNYVNCLSSTSKDTDRLCDGLSNMCVSVDLVSDTDIPDTMADTVVLGTDVPDTVSDRLEKFTLHTKGAIDGLFWSMFLAHHGMNEYHRVGVNNGNEEMKEKNKIVEYLHGQSATLFNTFSNYKVTKAFVTDAISDLLTCAKMKWSGLVAMSLFYQANILIVDYDKKIYLPFLVGNALQTYILYRNPLYNKKDRTSVSYFVDVAEKIMSYEQIQNTMIGLIHYEKPLKGISTYKSTDLESMAEKVGIDVDDENGKMLKKQDIYTKILLKCVWE
jgi:hypothetical protein